MLQINVKMLPDWRTIIGPNTEKSGIETFRLNPRIVFAALLVPRKSFKDSPQIRRLVNCCYETMRKLTRPVLPVQQA